MITHILPIRIVMWNCSPGISFFQQIQNCTEYVIYITFTQIRFSHLYSLSSLYYISFVAWCKDTKQILHANQFFWTTLKIQLESIRQLSIILEITRLVWVRSLKNWFAWIRSIQSWQIAPEPYPWKLAVCEGKQRGISLFSFQRIWIAWRYWSLWQYSRLVRSR